jgi:anaerobic selenocysteine-containing dehydrogenase
MENRKTHYGWCPVCEAECGIEITTEGRKILSIRGDEESTFSKGMVCPKAASLKDLYNDPDRLRYPVKRTGSDWRRIGWDEAFDEIGKKIRIIRKRYGNDAMALFLGNPNVHYHGNILYIALLMKVLNTRNRYSSSSLDQLPLMMACQQMFGHQLLFPVPDVDRTDFFIIMGGNPAVSGGSIMTAPGISKRIRDIRKRGGRVVVIDPVRTKTAELADRHHFIRPGTDVYLLAAMVNTLFEERLADPGRLGEFTDGIDTVKKAVARFTPENVADITGISAYDTRNLAREFAKAEKAVCYGRMGTSTQEYGVLSTWLILVFNILAGKMDRPGGYMFPTPALDLVGFTALAGEKGWVGRHRSRVMGYPDFGGELPAATLAEEILTPGKGRIRGLITVAGNPVVSAPNGRLTDTALADLEFMVAVDWYVNESTRHAHIILPPTTVFEHPNHTVMTNLAGVRNHAAYSEQVFPKDPDTRHNWEIIAGLTACAAENPLLRLALRFVRPELLLDGFHRLGPHGPKFGFIGPGLTLSKLKKARHGMDLGPLEPRLPNRLFTKPKRIRLAPAMFTDALKGIKTMEKNPGDSDGMSFGLALIGRRNLMSSNSWFHNYRRLRNRANRCTLLLNPADAEVRGIRTGDRVLVESASGSVIVEAEVTDRIMAGVVSIPHGWGHDLPGVRLGVASEDPGVNVNDLTDHRRVDLSGTAVFSGVPVKIRKYQSGSDRQKID